MRTSLHISEQVINDFPLFRFNVDCVNRTAECLHSRDVMGGNYRGSLLLGRFITGGYMRI